MAYGPLNLTPKEFYELTPNELYKMLDGYNWRQKQHDERMAYWVANMINPHLKKAVSPRQLLNPIYPDDVPKGTVRTKEETEEFMAQFKEVIGDGNDSRDSR